MEVAGETMKVQHVVAGMAQRNLINSPGQTGIANSELLQLTWIETHPDIPVPTGTFYTVAAEALNKYGQDEEDDDDDADEESATGTQATAKIMVWIKAHYSDLLNRLQDIEFSSTRNLPTQSTVSFRKTSLSGRA